MTRWLSLVLPVVTACTMESVRATSRPIDWLVGGDAGTGDVPGDVSGGDAVGDSVSGDAMGDPTGDPQPGDLLPSDPMPGDPIAGDGDPSGGEDPVYQWQTGDWSGCSANCGGGVQTRDVWCEELGGGSVSGDLCTPPAPPDSQDCNEHACSTCTIGGTQLQDTACVNATFQTDRETTADCFAWCKTTAENAGFSDRTVCCNHVPGWEECRLYRHPDTVATVGRVAVMLTCD